MRIATWNVNSIRARYPLVIAWLLENNIDVLAMQEIKCRPDQFPIAEFARAGYEVEIHGYNQWNGVAFASRHAMSNVTKEFPNMPGFGKEIAGANQASDSNGLPHEARALGVTIGDLRLWSLYVPNGRALGDPHYKYKLEWLRALRQKTGEWVTQNPTGPLALMGDFNIAPLTSDMGDPSFVEGKSTHVSEPEREVFKSFLEVLDDPVRKLQPEGYTFWDYKAGRFQKNEGMRIDFILGSKPFNELVVEAGIDRNARKGDGPSDHVPVWVQVNPALLETHDEDDLDRPMVF